MQDNLKSPNAHASLDSGRMTGNAKALCASVSGEDKGKNFKNDRESTKLKVILEKRGD